MSTIHILEREMTDAEFARRCAGSREYAIEQGNPVQTSEEFSFVVLDGETYIGCATGEAYKNGPVYNGWAYLSSLFIEKPYRGQGLGAALLPKLEDRVRGLGIGNIWTRTAGHEARGFYVKQGYQVIFELEGQHPSGQSHIGLRKSLGSSPCPNDTGAIRIVERAMTDSEFARMNAGFDEHSLEHGNLVAVMERHGLVALDADAFIGCASGVTYKSERGYNKWFFLSDLFVEKAYRDQGLGTTLLPDMEAKVAGLGARHVCTWIAGYEALGFFGTHDYEVFCELENWYHTGHSRFGLRKTM